MSRAVEAEDTRTVSSDHPFGADRNYGSDPVVFQSRTWRWCS